MHPISTLVVLLVINSPAIVVPLTNVKYRMATQTAYESSIELDEEEGGFFASQNKTSPPQCSKQDNILYVAAHIRHGARYPKAKDTKISERILEKLRNLSMPLDTLNRMWKIIKESKKYPEKSLAPAGKSELRSIGRFFAEKYADHFKNLNSEDVNFTITSASRTFESYQGFMEGFRSESVGRYITPLPVVNDALLRFFERCPKYVEEIEENVTNLAIVDRFVAKMLPKLTEAFANSTELPGLTLDEKEVMSYFYVAATELALHNETNWANFMDQKVIDILEYAVDLKYYWKRGPAYPLSYEMSCDVISDLFHAFDGAIRGINPLKGSFYFSHAETILPILNILGLFRDRFKLTENNFESTTTTTTTTINDQRSFRTTRMIPFASNIAFVLHHCPHITTGAMEDEDGKWDNGTKESEDVKGDKKVRTIDFDDVFIELLFKGQPIEWPFCKNSICRYPDVRAQFSDYIDRCDFNGMCKKSSGVPSTASFLYIVTMVMVNVVSMFF